MPPLTIPADLALDLPGLAGLLELVGLVEVLGRRGVDRLLDRRDERRWSNAPGCCSPILSTCAACAWLATSLPGGYAAACAVGAPRRAGACAFGPPAAVADLPFMAWKLGSACRLLAAAPAGPRHPLGRPTTAARALGTALRRRSGRGTSRRRWARGRRRAAAPLGAFRRRPGGAPAGRTGGSGPGSARARGAGRCRPGLGDARTDPGPRSAARPRPARRPHRSRRRRPRSRRPAPRPRRRPRRWPRPRRPSTRRRLRHPRGRLGACLLVLARTEDPLGLAALRPPRPRPRRPRPRAATPRSPRRPRSRRSRPAPSPPRQDRTSARPGRARPPPPRPPPPRRRAARPRPPRRPRSRRSRPAPSPPRRCWSAIIPATAALPTSRCSAITPDAENGRAGMAAGAATASGTAATSCTGSSSGSRVVSTGELLRQVALGHVVDGGQPGQRVHPDALGLELRQLGRRRLFGPRPRRPRSPRARRPGARGGRRPGCPSRTPNPEPRSAPARAAPLRGPRLPFRVALS